MSVYHNISIANLCMNQFECPGKCGKYDIVDTTADGLNEGLFPRRRRRQERGGTDTATNHLFHQNLVNPYHVLQIRRDATPSEIRHAYRRLSLWHHPGRQAESKEERQRRLQVFEIVAACYETLISNDSRRRLDHLLQETESKKSSSGPLAKSSTGADKVLAMDSSSPHVATKSLLIVEEDDEDDIDDLVVPGLSRASSSSSLSGGHDDDQLLLFSCTPTPSACQEKTKLNKILNVSTSTSGEEAEVHFTQSETNRLFGGPLSMLYRARKWEPFTDPFLLFEELFGHPVFPDLPHDFGKQQEWKPLRATRSAGWQGSSHIEEDGSTVYTTTRILHDRRLTRTEAVVEDPRSGVKKTVITVTSEDLIHETLSEELEPANTCMICYAVPDDDVGSDEEALVNKIGAVFRILLHQVEEQLKADVLCYDGPYDSQK